MRAQSFQYQCTEKSSTLSSLMVAPNCSTNSVQFCLQYFIIYIFVINLLVLKSQIKAFDFNFQNNEIKVKSDRFFSYRFNLLYILNFAFNSIRSFVYIPLHSISTEYTFLKKPQYP